MTSIATSSATALATSLTTSVATVVATLENGQAITTLLTAYKSADATLYSANSDAISLASSFAEAQSSYNAALSRGETPSPPTLPIVVNGTTQSVTAASTSAASTGSATTSRSSLSQSSQTSSSSSSSTTSASDTGAGPKLSAKFALVCICGLVAALAVSA